MNIVKRGAAWLIALLMIVTTLPFTAPTAEAAVADELTVSQNGIELIKKFEGFHSTCYQDVTQSSIGYGTKCGDTLHASGAHSISKKNAEAELIAKLEEVYVPKVHAQMAGVEMTQGQFDALVSLAFNTGAGSSILRNSPLGRYLNRELTEAEARSLYSGFYVKSGGVTVSGLVSRRNAEADLFFYGEAGSHTCSLKTYKFDWSAHPHYSCYQCSVCGVIKENINEPHYFESCAACHSVDIGTDFYAEIRNISANKPITKDESDNYIRLRSATGEDNQLWKFERQTNGSYKITSAADGKILELLDGKLVSGTPAAANKPDWGTAYQRWYICKQGNGYMLFSQHGLSSNLALELQNGSSNDGTSVVNAVRHNGSSQIWSIISRDENAGTVPVLTVNTNDPQKGLSFSWNEVFGASRYDLKIWKNKVTESEPFCTVHNAVSGCTAELPEGNYQAYVEAVYNVRNVQSNTVSFKVGKTGWAQENGRWYYYRNGVKISGQWLLDNGKWYYLEANGCMATTAWKKDSVGWVYVGADGAMLTNAWCTDSKGWCYVGANGYAVTNCWKNDSVGRIWLDSEGSMVRDRWILDGGKWYYVDVNGYMAKNAWKRDSIGWCYVGADGAMLTNAWCKDSKGWCYVGANGYAVTNCWKKDSVGWIWLDSEGSMTKNEWIYDGGKWYYLDANGYMLSNCWRKIGGYEYYFYNNGVMAANTRIDGYYVNGGGQYVPGI